MKRDDSLWKAILEDVFDDFLRFFFPNATDEFDLERGFEYLDKELEQLFPPDQDTFAPRYVDKLVKVFTKAAGVPSERWMLIHIEVQGYRDAAFAERMFQYYYRIFDKYHQPITAFAIFTDTHRGYQPRQYEQVHWGTRLLYQYNTYKILDQNPAELRISTNPFALVIATAYIALTSRRLTADQLVNLKIDIAKQLLTSQLPKTKIRSLMNFLRYYVRLENQEEAGKFEQAIEEITQRTTTMGIEQFLLERAKQEGIQKGMEKGVNEKNRTFTETLLRETNFSTAEIARLVGVSVAFVEEVKKMNNA